MSTSLKMFLLAVFAVILLMAVGCDQGHYDKSTYWDVKCEAPYYTGPANRYAARYHGTWIRTPDGIIYDYGPAVKCEGRRR